MDENRRPRAARVRRGSSPEVAARLQRSRRRALDHRAAVREREKIVTAAVRDYINAWHAIGLVQQRRDTDIDDLKRRIQDVTVGAANEIADHEQAQAAAAAAIQEQGHTDNEIAELLEISTKRARQLVSASGRTEAAKTGNSQPDTDSEQVGASGVHESEDSDPLGETGRTRELGHGARKGTMPARERPD
ncbi:hypothetical protein K7711_44250 [Nocardia sp. CA2R105]|uniref:hypothetical protein n=1 Tax=Nocardia coffeae TaxID=2873381 RepID=UPI001CA71278|nr:hypothetical protein [Nocardia coffeae]MBY8863545.1 hypothetical protein [Nocardia coffeae]